MTTNYFRFRRWRIRHRILSLPTATSHVTCSGLAWTATSVAQDRLWGIR